MTRQNDIDTNDEAVRLLATLVRLQTGSQSEAIIELDRAGIGVTRIAELLGTTKGTANVAIQRAKKKRKAT
jgi:DNA-directed RNA polymerase specialized sigma24 family protein